MSRVLLVGRHGFLGRHISAALGSSAMAMSHCTFREAGIPETTGCIVWAARNPQLGHPSWRLREDLEWRAAEIAHRRRIAFISLSSRKVYAPSRQPVPEEAPTTPVDLYGRQKRDMELALLDLLQNRVTILRLANIFGLEPGRPTFMGRLQSRLRDRGEVLFDMSPFVVRDFLPVETAARWIARLATNPPGGVIHVGSGHAMATGRIALAVIEGYGGGRLVIEDGRERDPFVLDTSKLRARIGETITPQEILDRCRALGRELREA